MKQKKVFLPVVARRTAFALHNPYLSVVVFERSLTPEERRGFEQAVMDFYSGTAGGPRRPLIDVEYLAADTYGFRKVLGREFPTMDLFGQLLAWLNEKVGFSDVAKIVSIDQISLPSTTTPFVHPKWGRHTVTTLNSSN